jgi:hypothetical protein
VLDSRDVVGEDGKKKAAEFLVKFKGVAYRNARCVREKRGLV